MLARKYEHRKLTRRMWATMHAVPAIWCLPIFDLHCLFWYKCLPCGARPSTKTTQFSRSRNCSCCVCSRVDNIVGSCCLANDILAWERRIRRIKIRKSDAKHQQQDARLPLHGNNRRAHAMKTTLLHMNHRQHRVGDDFHTSKSHSSSTSTSTNTMQHSSEARQQHNLQLCKNNDNNFHVLYNHIKTGTLCNAPTQMV